MNLRTGGRGSKNPKFLWTSLMEAPKAKLVKLVIDKVGSENASVSLLTSQLAPPSHLLCLRSKHPTYFLHFIRLDLSQCVAHL